MSAAAQIGMISRVECTKSVYVSHAVRTWNSLTIAKGVGKLWVHNLAVAEDNWKAATRRRISHVDTETDGAHDGHGDDVESSGFDPLTKRRAAVVRGCAVTVHPGLFASKDAASFLVVSACGGRGISCGWRRSAIEETHCRLWLPLEGCASVGILVFLLLL